MKTKHAGQTTACNTVQTKVTDKEIDTNALFPPEVYLFHKMLFALSLIMKIFGQELFLFF